MRISVIIPVYNAEETIENCILSVIDQSLPAECYEIIVVDNNSTDRTKSIIEKYPVRYIFEPYPSVYKARNTAVAHSSGEVLAFIDGDCIADSKWLQEGLRMMQTFEIGLGTIFPQKSPQKYLYLYDRLVYWKSIIVNKDDLNIWAGNSFISRKLFEELGGFNDKIVTAGDSILSMIAKKLGYHIGFASKSIVYHPVDPLGKRLRRSLREGLGADLKAPYKHENYLKIPKIKIFRGKVHNLMKNIFRNIQLLKDAKKKGKIHNIDFFRLIILDLFLIFSSYVGIFVGKYCRIISNKWAIK